ncbi:hypothetical protein GRS48_04170 [Halorubrum sp. JWXQ-INN 858]|uniref:hypothetical protein n=1 Tax=Halorubrum sp. JWXQ-INN 858 TaxID=2690782 RepID=UPI001359DB07|nr:hypothetical protein [Halorubrum sp. JWXQ-INN 858]MWV64021.1 hypothetical protein [Halorubrum sp. JWXQ-INN 858]
MLSLFGFATLAALVVGHVLLAGVMTRFFRLRLETTWGWILYTAVLTPIALLGSTLLFTGVFGVGTGVDLGSPAAVVAVLVFLPVVLGAAIDYLYMPPPDEYELPDTQ